MGKATNPKHSVARAYFAGQRDDGKPSVDRDMRVGARVFRAGSLVSDVLDAAAQAYQDNPLPSVMPELSDAHKGKTATAIFLAEVKHVIDGKPNWHGVLELLDAFMVTTVADVAPDDRPLFLQRIRERFAT